MYPVNRDYLDIRTTQFVEPRRFWFRKVGYSMYDAT
jgi:hypothetical protein